MTTFVLVHGACHGGWCWDRLAAELAERGHDVVAPDLPCEDPSAGIEEYADTVVNAMDGREDCVVVGHSMAGVTVPVVASRTPVAALVFLAAIVTAPGRSIADMAEVDADREFPMTPGEDFTSFDDGTFVFSPAGAARVLYQDCTPEDTAFALGRLRRQGSLWTRPMPIDAWPDVPMASIVCTRDRIINPAWSDRVARERLGVEPVHIDSGHSPFLSRPRELADLLTTGLGTAAP